MDGTTLSLAGYFLNKAGDSFSGCLPLFPQVSNMPRFEGVAKGSYQDGSFVDVSMPQDLGGRNFRNGKESGGKEEERQLPLIPLINGRRKGEGGG